jgi:hypothetical protein
MPPRRLEDRIRQLCAKAVAAPESDLEPVITELKVALHEHTERLRKLAALKLARTITRTTNGHSGKYSPRSTNGGASV